MITVLVFRNEILSWVYLPWTVGLSCSKRSFSAGLLPDVLFRTALRFVYKPSPAHVRIVPWYLLIVTYSKRPKCLEWKIIWKIIDETYNKGFLKTTLLSENFLNIKSSWNFHNHFSIERRRFFWSKGSGIKEYIAKSQWV